MKVLVLGAGVIGVTTAYYLNKKGYDVTVVDRNSQSAAECSFANGGQLSYAHVEPWASPSVLTKIPKWLIKENSPLVFRLRLDPAMWAWALKFLSCCNETQALESAGNMMRLSLFSKESFKELMEDTKISFHHLNRGILHTFRCRKTFDANIEQADFQKKLGCRFEILDSREKCEALEPAIKSSPEGIIGGIYFPDDESGDVNEFTVNLTKVLQSRGVKFEYNTNIQDFNFEGYKIKGVITDKGVLQADKYVVSTGAYSSVLLKKIGINVPIYPMKGYSISIKIKDESKAPKVGITDQGNKIVFSRLGDIIRVAGTAEFAGYDDSVKTNRIKTLKAMVRENFPECGDIDNAGEWACLRPSTPDGSPIIGETKYNNLFLNTGHGTLGWTLSCGSAKAIANIVHGEEPDVNLKGLNLERYYDI